MIADDLDALALQFLEASSDLRVLAIAARLAELAVRAHQQEAAVVPLHLRQAPAALPPGVVKLCGRRARP